MPTGTDRIGWVLVLERREGLTHNWRVLERRLGLPVLTDVPGHPGHPAASPGSKSSSQAYTQLRNVLLNGLSNGGIVVVAESEQGSGVRTDPW